MSSANCIYFVLAWVWQVNVQTTSWHLVRVMPLKAITVKHACHSVCCCVCNQSYREHFIDIKTWYIHILNSVYHRKHFYFITHSVPNVSGRIWVLMTRRYRMTNDLQCKPCVTWCVHYVIKLGLQVAKRILSKAERFNDQLILKHDCIYVADIKYRQ